MSIFNRRYYTDYINNKLQTKKQVSCTSKCQYRYRKKYEVNFCSISNSCYYIFKPLNELLVEKITLVVFETIQLPAIHHLTLSFQFIGLCVNFRRQAFSKHHHSYWWLLSLRWPAQTIVGKMTALPTSLRRTMLMLLAAMCMIVMVFYWNQSPIKPMSFMSSVYQAANRNM